MMTSGYRRDLRDRFSGSLDEREQKTDVSVIACFGGVVLLPSKDPFENPNQHCEPDGETGKAETSTNLKVPVAGAAPVRVRLICRRERELVNHIASVSVVSPIPSGEARNREAMATYRNGRLLGIRRQD
jgi:hypothetical protein